ncbi:MAG: ABC transporter ATP-binding protein [Rhizobiaceae bacterium]|nr:ABC transporter ATP-binding protein [Rhizobiaceae bacterium]
MLTAEGLVVRYADSGGTMVSVLDGVSFAPVPGALVAVTGPSGSGKSTLLNVLSGLVRPEAGQVTFAGSNVSALSETRRDRWRRDTIGLIFQSFHLIDELSPRQNVACAAWFDRLSAKALYPRADELLARLGVPTRRKTLKGFSRGERQRVAIARALLFDPPIILADEPTASLDGAAGREVGALLVSLARDEGRTVVAVTHDPELIAVADVVHDLDHGRLHRRQRP